MDGVIEVQRRLSIEYETIDFSVGIHDGPIAGQEVPHFHIHILGKKNLHDFSLNING